MAKFVEIEAKSILQISKSLFGVGISKASQNIEKLDESVKEVYKREGFLVNGKSKRLEKKMGHSKYD